MSTPITATEIRKAIYSASHIQYDIVLNRFIWGATGGMLVQNLLHIVPNKLISLGSQSPFKYFSAVCSFRDDCIRKLSIDSGIRQEFTFDDIERLVQLTGQFFTDKIEQSDHNAKFKDAKAALFVASNQGYHELYDLDFSIADEAVFKKEIAKRLLPKVSASPNAFLPKPQASLTENIVDHKELPAIASAPIASVVGVAKKG